MQISKDKTCSIGDASRITGVSWRKLRSWEGKHIPKPEYDQEMDESDQPGGQLWRPYIKKDLRVYAEDKVRRRV